MLDMMSLARFSQALARLSLATCLLTWGSGCDQDEIRSYSAPKDPPPPSADRAAPPPGEPDQHQRPPATWIKPPDWRVDPTPASFAIASFVAGAEDKPVRITLTRLAGEGGGALANINRWRSQINLPPVASLDEQPITAVKLDGLDGSLVDLQAEADYGSDPSRTVGVLVFHGREAWFVKMTGPATAVEKQRPAFDQFVASIRLDHSQHAH